MSELRLITYEIAAEVDRLWLPSPIKGEVVITIDGKDLPDGRTYKGPYFVRDSNFLLFFPPLRKGSIMEVLYEEMKLGMMYVPSLESLQLPRNPERRETRGEDEVVTILNSGRNVITPEPALQSVTVPVRKLRVGPVYSREECANGFFSGSISDRC